MIIEDDCFIGAAAVLTEGILVRRGAVLAPGVRLSASVPIYDTVHQCVHRGEIPADAVVVPGSRPLRGRKWAEDEGLQIGCAVIVKYRDQKTSAAVVLEDILR